MDRTLISFNLPNLITITLMAAVGYLAVAAIYQVASRAVGDSSTPASGQ